MKRGLIIILLMGYSVVGFSQNHVITEELKLERTKDKSLIYKAYKGAADLAINTIGTDRINMKTGAGSVLLKQSSDRKMFVKAEIYVTANSKSSAYEIVDEHLTLTLKKEGDEVYLVSSFGYDHDNHEPFGFLKAPARKVDLTIYAPANIDIKLDDRSGELVVKNVSNNLDIKDTSGGVHIEDVRGDLRLVDHSGEIKIKDVNDGGSINHSINIRDYSGELSLHNVTGQTKIVDTSGGLNISNLNGELEVDDNSGGINIKRVNGPVDIDDTSGGIRVFAVDGSIDVSDTSGEIYINTVSEDVYIRNDGSGDLIVRNCEGHVKGRVRKLY